MTKREFLKELEDRLQMLDEKERKDMIEEYSQHISMCMKSGMKEEEAIEDFGDMDDLIAEILEAYHLDPEYEVKSRERSGKTGIADLLPKDFFKKKTKIAKAGNKSNVNDGNNKSNYQLKSRNNGAYLYHLLLLQKIKDDIDADNLYRYHFSLLRQVLEIIASFMGKNRRIGQVLNFIEEDDDMVNQINANAHKDIYDYQDGKLVQDNKEVIIRIYNKLITKFNFNLKKV